MPRHFAVALAVTVLCAGIALHAQRPTDVVGWSVEPAAIQITPRGTVDVTLTARVQAGWHLYALTQPKGGPNPLKIAVPQEAPLTIDAAAIQAPKPEVVSDPNFDLETRQYDGTVTFTVPIAAKGTARPGKHDTALEVTFQACGNGICLRPYTQKLPLSAVILPLPVRRPPDR
jgi:DsbC/DsbD-like thiol-disulfide interchange protein